MTGETAKHVTEWIERDVIPKILQSVGKTGSKIRYNITVPKVSFFISCICFLDLIFEQDEKNSGNVSEEKLSVVIKRSPLDDIVAAKMNMPIQFHNEILFYKKVARGNSRFPRCIFADDGTPENTVIVTENMNPRGYEICTKAYDIPIEYVFSAVNEIARFHGMTYVMKEKEPGEFRKVIDEVREARFIPDNWLNDFINIVSSRPLLWLRKNNYDPKFCDKIEKFFGDAFNNVMLASLKPVEPLATLCHGDFTRNNVLFRRVDGKLEAMLIDFAVMGYYSPGTDLSTFFYLNCSSDDRINRFNDIFKSYHDTLMDYLREAGIKNLEKYSYDNMLNEYKRVAAFGFIIAIYFWPIIRDPSLADIRVVRDDHKAGARQRLKIGGTEMDELLGKMVLELRDIGYLDLVC